MREERVSWVDALRGFAALAVAWFHLFTDQKDLIGIPWLTHVAVVGRYGVELFFAISGFVLALTLIPREDMRGPGDIGLYMVRRSIRLDLTLWVAVLLYIACQGALQGRAYAPGFQWDKTLASFLYFIPMDAKNYIPVAWTLAIEVQFYLLFAILVAVINWLTEHALQKRRAVAIVMGAVVLSTLPFAAGLVKMEVGVWMYPHLLTFAVGSTAALIWMRHKSGPWLYGLAMLLATVWAARAGERGLATVIAGAVFGVMVWSRPLQAVLSHRVLIYFGAISYSLYLLHSLVGALVIDYLGRRFPTPSPFHILGVVEAVAFSIAASSLLHAIIEKPSITLSRRIGLDRQMRLTPLSV